MNEPAFNPSDEAERAVREAEQLLRHPGATVSVVGDTPWHQRALSKLRGPAGIVLMYAASLMSLPLGPTTTEPQSAPNAAAMAQAVAGDPLGLKQVQLMSPVALQPLLDTQQASPKATTKAAFDVPSDMSSQQVAIKLFDKGKQFQALAVTLEGLETKPYRDGCGLNVGMGYCIDARTREHGPARIRQDLLDAGIQNSQVDALLGNDRKAQMNVELTRTQALALLALTENDYRVRARDLVGQKVFDSLPENRQAVLTWLSYNTGEGLARFNRLLTAVRQDRTTDAVQHMTPFFSQGGQMGPTARAGSWLMASDWSNDAMKAALARPDALEYGARQGQSPLEVVAPGEAGRLALRGHLPQSPYVAHGMTTLKGLETTNVQVAQVATAELASVEMPTTGDWRERRSAAYREALAAQKAAQEAPQATAPTADLQGHQPANLQDLLQNLPVQEQEAEAPRRRSRFGR